MALKYVKLYAAADETVNADYIKGRLADCGVEAKAVAALSHRWEPSPFASGRIRVQCVVETPDV